MWLKKKQAKEINEKLAKLKELEVVAKECDTLKATNERQSAKIKEYMSDFQNMNRELDEWEELTEYVNLLSTSKLAPDFWRMTPQQKATLLLKEAYEKD